MAKSTVASDVHQPFDIGGDLTTQIPFNLMAAVDDVSNLDDFVFGELTDPGIKIDSGLGKDFLRCAPADSIDIGESDFDPFVSWQINASDACHSCLLLSTLPGITNLLRKITGSNWFVQDRIRGSSLPLFVFGVFADDPNETLPFNNLTFVTYSLDRTLDFHSTLITSHLER